MLNFIKFLAAGGGLRDHKGLIWSHNPFLFDYQLLIEPLNWSLLNMAACEDVPVELSDLTGSGTGLEGRWQPSRSWWRCSVTLTEQPERFKRPLVH